MTTLKEIAAYELPNFHANIRNLARKDWAKMVRGLLKELGIKGVSVTAPNYSMVQSIDISLPELEISDGEHVKIHSAIDAAWIGDSWTGYAANGCEHCKARNEARKRIEEIILAAFPALDNRSDSQSDHFDFCLSIQ